MKLFVLLLITASFISCVKEVEFSFPEHSPKAVMNSLITADSLITLYWGESAASNEVYLQTIGEYKIDLYENGVKIPIDKTPIEHGFVLNYEVKAGCEYMVEATREGADTVFATTSVPLTAPVFEIERYIPQVAVDSDGEKMSVFVMNLHDNPEEHNFYEIHCGYYDSDYDLFSCGVSSNDIAAGVNLKNLSPNLLFDDQTFNGEIKVINCEVYDGSDFEGGMYVKVRSVSPEYYKYKQSLYRHQNGASADEWRGNGNPYQLYSNIEGGYGVFAGYREKADTILLSSVIDLQ